VKFGERGKSSGRHSRRQSLSGVWPCLWPRVDHGCVDLVKGFNRVH
jgi:hypothetical protein